MAIIGIINLMVKARFLYLVTINILLIINILGSLGTVILSKESANWVKELLSKVNLKI